MHLYLIDICCIVSCLAAYSNRALRNVLDFTLLVLKVDLTIRVKLAGDITTRQDVCPSVLLFHLSHIERAILLQSWYKGCKLLYAVRVDDIGKNLPLFA